MGDLSENFNRSEVACQCGCGFDSINPEIIQRVQSARFHFGIPIVINDGCRCKEHNSQVGGVAHSQHLLGNALDITALHISPDEIASYFERMYSKDGGVGRYNTFTHIDCRPEKARWDFRSKVGA